jgi:hypothetical protein
VGLTFLILLPYGAHCESDNAGNYYCTAYKIAAAIGTFVDMHNGAVTALATLAVAAFTFTLWRSTKGMLAATNNSINLARDEFISTHRPKLIVRQFQIDPVTPENPITILGEGDETALQSRRRTSQTDFLLMKAA